MTQQARLRIEMEGGRFVEWVSPDCGPLIATRDSIRDNPDEGTTTIHTQPIAGGKSEVTVMHKRVISIELVLPANESAKP